MTIHVTVHTTNGNQLHGTTHPSLRPDSAISESIESLEDPNSAIMLTTRDGHTRIIATRHITAIDLQEQP